MKKRFVFALLVGAMMVEIATVAESKDQAKRNVCDMLWNAPVQIMSSREETLNHTS